MAYWLLPESSHLLSSQQVIAELANRFQGPVIAPHATIYCGPFYREDDLDGILDRLSSFPKISLRPTGLDFGDRYTQCCFIRFEASAQLEAMSRIVQDMVRLPLSDYSVAPHMSLFYGSLDEEQRRLAQSVVKIPDIIEFDVVTAIANPPQVKCQREVEYWHEVTRRELHGL